MHFEIAREQLLPPLRILASIVERKQIQPVLGNALVSTSGGKLLLVGTDSHIEIACTIELHSGDDGMNTTIPILKWFEICRSLPDGSLIRVREEEHGRVSINAGKSKFSLATLPADTYPNSKPLQPDREFLLPQGMLRDLFARTSFAMAQQDVRFYLNGMLMHVQDEQVSMVATDGHRLALTIHPFAMTEGEPVQVIIPRKGVLELLKILEDSDDEVRIAIGGGHIRFELPKLTFTSKLIDGNYPDYARVIPDHPEHELVVDCAQFKQSLSRVAILANDNNKGVRLELSPNEFRIRAHNPEQEEAEEELDARYEGDDLEIGFNVSYLLDTINAIATSSVRLRFIDSSSSCLITAMDDDSTKYVIMPMRL